MPQRINGIGTSYLGKSNVLSRTGECEACRRGAHLTSYDTRLWFTFFFIPVIPLGKKRILDYCASCTTHRAVPLAEWAAVPGRLSGQTDLVIGASTDSRGRPRPATSPGTRGSVRVPHTRFTGVPRS